MTGGSMGAPVIVINAPQSETTLWFTVLKNGAEVAWAKSPVHCNRNGDGLPEPFWSRCQPGTVDDLLEVGQQLKRALFDASHTNLRERAAYAYMEPRRFGLSQVGQPAWEGALAEVLTAVRKVLRDDSVVFALDEQASHPSRVQTLKSLLARINE
jgi:hypothetical protein